MERSAWSSPELVPLAAGADSQGGAFSHSVLEDATYSPSATQPPPD